MLNAVCVVVSVMALNVVVTEEVIVGVGSERHEQKELSISLGRLSIKLVDEAF